MMKEEIKEKRPVSSKWLLFTVLGIVFIILAIKQYKPGTWGYYFAHIYFLIGGILIITFSGAFILEQAKKEPFYFRYALKINQLDSKYQSNILIILMLFVIHFFALSYIGTQIVEILPLDKTNSNYPYDIIWMARQNDEKYSEKIAEKYNGTVKHIPMIRATMFYSQEEIGISESTYKELTGKAYGLSGKEIVIGIEDQNYQREEKVTDKVLYDLFGWLYIGKFNPNKKEFESSNILKDANYQYRIKEIHTQNVFGKFVPEDAGEGCEDTVIFSDEYFDKQWKKQAADDEEVSMLEVFSFPKTKEQMAWKDLEKEMEQGFQGWEYKFNSVSSSRGDYPFITVTAGINTSKYGKLATITMLRVRQNGQGKPGHKKPVLFPKIVFLYDENLHGPGKELEDVFEAGIECSSKTMYPDWLSLTGKGYVASMYKRYGKVISPMGCRAFLSPWYERGGMSPADDNDKPVFVGRFNIGAISLHLPMIYAKAKQESKDFFKVLDYYLELIRQLHIRTYEYLGEMKASTNPLAYCEGGFYGGNLGLYDKIKPLLKSATASFGITALNELQQLHNKKSLVEDGAFALETMEYINKRINEFKEEDGHLYAIYGTPAENLCGVQVQQFRKKYGIIENVSDRSYVSNSFHCHVTEEITPIEKQNLEGRFWDLLNGGKIQYVKYPINYNKEAIKSLVRRAMELGFYEGVNLSLAYCDDCGHEELSMDVCPVCGSSNLTKIDRMNGYLSYSRVKGDTRLNDAKMAEIAERKSM